MNPLDPDTACKRGQKMPWWVDGWLLWDAVLAGVGDVTKK